MNNKIKEPKTFEEFETFGVLAHHANISKISTKTLLRTFYRVNLIEQTRFLINLERMYLRHGMHEQFFDTITNNRFIFKFKELIRIRREKNESKEVLVDKSIENINSSLQVN